MDQIIPGIIVAIVSAFIISKLKIGSTSRTIVTIQGGHTTTKKWKVLIVIGAALFFGGAFYGISWSMAKGFSDYHTEIGFCFAILGFPTFIFGKFGAW